MVKKGSVVNSARRYSKPLPRELNNKDAGLVDTPLTSSQFMRRPRYKYVLILHSMFWVQVRLSYSFFPEIILFHPPREVR